MRTRTKVLIGLQIVCLIGVLAFSQTMVQGDAEVFVPPVADTMLMTATEEADFSQIDQPADIGKLRVSNAPADYQLEQSQIDALIRIVAAREAGPAALAAENAVELDNIAHPLPGVVYAFIEGVPVAIATQGSPTLNEAELGEALPQAIAIAQQIGLEGARVLVMTKAASAGKPPREAPSETTPAPQSVDATPATFAENTDLITQAIAQLGSGDAKAVGLADIATQLQTTALQIGALKPTAEVSAVQIASKAVVANALADAVRSISQYKYPGEAVPAVATAKLHNLTCEMAIDKTCIPANQLPTSGTKEGNAVSSEIEKIGTEMKVGVGFTEPGTALAAGTIILAQKANVAAFQAANPGAVIFEIPVITDPMQVIPLTPTAIFVKAMSVVVEDSNNMASLENIITSMYSIITNGAMQLTREQLASFVANPSQVIIPILWAPERVYDEGELEAIFTGTNAAWESA